MITLLFGLGCILTGVLYFKKRELENKGGRTFTYHLVHQSLDFLVPFCIVTFFFLVLSLFVSGQTDSATIRKLIWMENTLEYVKRKASFLKLGPAFSFILLSALFLINLLGIPSIYTEKFYPVFKKYRKVNKKVYVALVILCSFTFFGTQLGQPIAKLRIRINERFEEARKGYGDLSEQVHSAISKEVVGRLYDETYKALPQSYQASLRRQEELANNLANLRTRYDDGTYRYYDPEDLPAISIVLQRETGEPNSRGEGNGSEGPKDRPPTPSSPSTKSGSDSSSPSSSNLKPVVEDFFEPAQTPHSTSQKAPSEIVDPQEVKNAAEVMTSFSGAYQTKAIGFFKTEAGTDLLMHPPKFVTSSIKKYLFEELTQRYPILGPIIDVFVGSFAKEMSAKVKEASERATDRIIQNPKQVSSIINNEVTHIVNAKVSAIPSSITKRAQTFGNATIEKLSKVTDFQIRLEQRQNEAENQERERKEIAQRFYEQGKYDLLKDQRNAVAKYINLLKCPVHSNRLAAVIFLSTYAHLLTEDDVIEIKGMLNDSEMRYIIIGEDRPFTEGVTTYEKAPVKYYAAQALSLMDSPYLSVDEKTQARLITLNAGVKRSSSRAFSTEEIYKTGTT